MSAEEPEGLTWGDVLFYVLLIGMILLAHLASEHLNAECQAIQP